MRVHSAVSAPREAIDHLCEVAEVLTARAREQGAVRGDIAETDIVLLLGGIHQTAAPLLASRPQVWRRYLELALDGLCTDNARALPHPPPSRLRLGPDPAADG